MGLSLPIMGGMASQNILNLVDTAMVGVLGNAALAAVGIGSFANFMFQAAIMGIATGVQAVAARRKGEGNISESAYVLNTALFVVLAISLPWSSLINHLVPYIFPYLNADPEVIELGIPYLKIRVLAICFVGMNYSFRGYWSAIDRTKLYLYTLLAMHISNVFLNYVLIYGKLGFPELGVAGAGLGTSISTALGTFIYMGLGAKYATGHGFLKTLPGYEDVAKLLKLSLPTSVQQFFFATGFTALYWIIGKVGTLELAAANVIINITLVCILPAMGLGIASSTLVGQALGRKEPDDANQWAWEVSRVGIVLLLALGLPMWIFPEWVLSGFIYDSLTMMTTAPVMQLVGLTIALESVVMVMMHSLMGAGATRPVMFASIGVQWLVFLPIAYVLGPVMGKGLFEIWAWNVISRNLLGLAFAMLWVKGDWKKIQV